ncbi:hypothetical protein I553_9272, partial [Mycobacterium xenopi 4042]
RVPPAGHSALQLIDVVLVLARSSRSALGSHRFRAEWSKPCGRWRTASVG